MKKMITLLAAMLIAGAAGQAWAQAVNVQDVPDDTSLCSDQCS